MGDETQSWKVVRDGHIEGHVAYAGPGAVQVPMVEPEPVRSNFFGMAKDATLATFGDLGVWADKQDGVLGTLAYGVGGLGYMLGTAMPGSAAEAAFMVATGPMVGAGVGLATDAAISKAPWLGMSVSDALSRTGMSLGSTLDSMAYARLQQQGLLLNAMPEGVTNAGGIGLSVEDQLVLQGDASRAQIVQAIGEAIQPSLKAILSLDSEAQVGFRGSLANGLKNDTKLGPNGERVAFDGVVATKNGKPFTDQQGYDADFFVVSDNLAAKLGNKPFFRNVARLDSALNGVFDDFGVALEADPLLGGMKVEPPTFRVFTSAEIQKKLNSGDSQIYFIPRRP